MERGRAFEYHVASLQSHLSLVEQLRDAVDHLSVCQPLPAEGVVVSVVGPYTPVPMADFQEELCDTFYNYCINPEVKHRVFYDIIPASNAVLLFGVPEQTCRVIEDVLGNVHYVSSITPVLKQMLRYGEPRQCLICAHDHSIDLLIFEGVHLNMLNSYKVDSPDDVAYYVLGVFNQFGLNPEQMRISVIGSAAHRNPIISRLADFVSQVVPVLPSQIYDHEMAKEDRLPYDLVAYILSKFK